MQYHLTSQKLYHQMLLGKNRQGGIVFNFLDISVRITERSAIGDLFQEWLAAWMKQQNVYFRVTSDTQKFPDFFLNEDSNITGLLELKTFNYSASPGFDIANFEAYCNSLTTHAYRLDADYLIIAYQLSEGKFSIKDVWLKKVWEITSASERYPIKCQIKKDMIYNIRPNNFKSIENNQYPPFQSKFEFIQALYKTLLKYSKTKGSSYDWLDRVKDNYYQHTGDLLL